jgi:hypothetical protein
MSSMTHGRPALLGLIRRYVAAVINLFLALFIFFLKTISYSLELTAILS